MIMEYTSQFNPDGIKVLETSSFIMKVQQFQGDQSSSEKEAKRPKITWRHDFSTILFLMYMYFLQGVLIGLSSAVSILIAARGMNYSAQGTYSFVFWPFSIKLLWAPIVDSLYVKRIGRRRSWIVPVNLLISIFLLTSAQIAQDYTSRSFLTKPEIVLLTAVFFLLTFMAATQDVVIDGWALSLLSRANVHWQSICNAAGQTIGISVGSTLFIILESPKFCNDYIRPIFGMSIQEHGFIDLKTVMYFYGVLFLVTGITIAIFKKENNIKRHVEETISLSNEEISSSVNDEKESKTNNQTIPKVKKLNLLESYLVIYRLLSIKPVQELCIILLTVNIGLATREAFILKLIEYGVPKESLSILAIPMSLISMIWPLLVQKCAANRSPFMLYFKLEALKVVYLISGSVLLFFTPIYLKDPVTNSYSMRFYVVYLFYAFIGCVLDSSTFVCMMSFFSRISDPAVGGIMMTFLTTMNNLGNTYPATVALYLIELLTVKSCHVLHNFALNMTTTTDQNSNYTSIKKTSINKCSTHEETEVCKESLKGVCNTERDAFYILSGALGIFAFVWFLVFYRIAKKMAKRPSSDWKLNVEYNI